MRYILAIILFTGWLLGGTISSSIDLSPIETYAGSLETGFVAEDASVQNGGVLSVPLNQDLGMVRTCGNSGWCRVFSPQSVRLARPLVQYKNFFPRDILRHLHLFGNLYICRGADPFYTGSVSACLNPVIHYVYGMRKILI